MKTHENTKQGWVDWASEQIKQQPGDANWKEDVNELLLEVYMEQFRESDTGELREVIRDLLWEGHMLKVNGFSNCDPFVFAALIVQRFEDDEETTCVEDCLDSIGWNVE